MTLNTRLRGASNSLISVISCTPGLITNSVFAIVVAPFPVFLSLIMFLLLFHFPQIVVQSNEALVPEAAVRLHPLRDVAERLALEPAGSPLRLAPASDQAGPLQHLEVLGDRGHRHVERRGELRNRGLARHQACKDRAPGGVGERCERAGESIRRRLGHLTPRLWKIGRASC